MFEIRSINAEEVDLFRSRIARGFGEDSETGDEAVERFDSIFEYDRTVAAFDGEDIVGTGGAHSLGLTVPGGREVPMGGTTIITVQPTHRRRGVLRSMMSHHLDDVSSRGEPLAGLWASESSIYGRFGYGTATFRHVSEVNSRAVHFTGDEDKGTVRLVDAEQADPILRKVYEEVRTTRAGTLTRTDAWWTHRRMVDPETWREGKTARRYLLHEENGTVTGYATYRQKEKWDDLFADGEVEVIEVISTTPEAHTGIWDFLTNVDLFPNLRWWNMPVDDPLPLKISDPRQVKRQVADAMWLRVMDVPAALGARGYDFDGRVILDVSDPFRPDNDGTYALEVVAGAGICERVDETPEIAFEIDVLGHLYLGGGDALAMYRAGMIEGDPDAVTKLHRIMRTDSQPWCPEVF